MIGQVRRLVPLLLVAFVVALTGGSLALAHGSGNSSAQQDQQSSGSHDQRPQRCDGHCHGTRHSAWDEQWLKMSIEGDLFEIAGGKIAQEQGSTQVVRDLGARLVADHSASLEDAVKLANKLGIDVPSEPSPTQQWELRVVSQFSGNAFDRWYSDLEVQDHVQDIPEAQDEVEKGCNRKVRHEARDEIPVLQEHLQLAQQALSAVSGS